MRSGELARLAQVSVRTLRHYHQVGVLPEPHRRANGYREYDVHDLVRLLRIKRLAALGFSLEAMGELLEGGTADHGGSLLEDLDAELSAQIDRLSRQREIIARLREHKADPDVPPELAPFLAAFAGAAPGAEITRIDREQFVLLAHFAGESGLGHLAGFYEQMSDPSLAPAVASFSARFAELGPASTGAEITAMVDDFAAAFGPMIRDFALADPGLDLTEVSGLLAAHTEDLLNTAQQRALAELERRLGRLWEDPDA